MSGPSPPPLTWPSPSSPALATQPSLAARILGDGHQQSKHRPKKGYGAEWFLPLLSFPLTAMRDLCTTQNQACWQECIRKEAAARVAWKIHYGHKYLKGGPTPRKWVQRTPFGSALAATSSTESKEVQVGWPESKGVRDQLSGGGGVQGLSPKGNKVWEAQRATQGPSVQPKPEGLEMRQVPPSTLQLFFQGLSHDGQGRALYLRERHRQKPEEKFLYPILSSWEYGWHVGKGHHHLATPGLCRQARSSSPALSFLTPHTHKHVPLAPPSPRRPHAFTPPDLCTFSSLCLECASCLFLCWLTFTCHLLREVL